VGRYCGPLELAALGPGCTLIDSCAYIFFFIATATTNRVAAAKADGNESESERVVSEALFIALCGGLFLTTVSLRWGEPLLRWIAGAASADVVPSALRYSDIRAWGQPFVIMASVARAAGLAAKDTQGPLLSVLLGFVLNAVGTVALVRFTNLGVAGAALATVVADAAAAAFLLLRRGGRKGPLVAVPSPARLFGFAVFALPILLTLLGKSVVYNGVGLSVGRCGAVALAAHQVLLRTFFFFTPIGDSVGMASQVFLPGVLAAQKKEREQQMASGSSGGGGSGLASPPRRRRRDGARRTLFAAGLVTGLLGASVSAVIPVTLSGVFTTDAAVAGALAGAAPLLGLAVALHAVALTCEGLLLAQRDLGFLSASYLATTAAAAALLLSPHRPASLNAAWVLLALFQGVRAVQFTLRSVWLARRDT